MYQRIFIQTFFLNRLLRAASRFCARRLCICMFDHIRFLFVSTIYRHKREYEFKPYIEIEYRFLKVQNGRTNILVIVTLIVYIKLKMEGKEKWKGCDFPCQNIPNNNSVHNSKWIDYFVTLYNNTLQNKTWSFKMTTYLMKKKRFDARQMSQWKKQEIVMLKIIYIYIYR